MPELTPQERLQPALLDRLTDEEPDQRQEPPQRRVMTKAQLKKAVLRDLGWLFNATRLESGSEFARAPAVRSSVINFGLPALSGKPASSLEVIDLERAVRQAIVEFEPRILPATLQVKALIDVDRLDHHNVIAIEIRGELWAQPVPLELEVRTEIDLETGRVRITELGTPGAG